MKKNDLAIKLATKEIDNLILKNRIDLERRDEGIKRFAKVHMKSSKSILIMKIEKNIIAFS